MRWILPYCLSFAPSLRRGGMVVLLGLLAACAAEQSSPLATGTPLERLYARGLNEIADLYIEPVSIRQLAISGGRRLTQLDNKLLLSEQPGMGNGTVLVLSYEAQPVATYPAPRTEAAQEWAALLTQMVGDARRASPRLAALPAEKIDKAIFDGATGVLDRFSRYSPPDVARDQRAARDGFGGIGVTLESNEAFRVTGVAPQSPAARAGIQIDDRIVAINGAQTAGREQTDIVHQLRGAVGSPVEVAIARHSLAHPKTFRMQRAQVMLPTVTMSLDGDIAVFRIASFNHSTTERLADALREAQRQSGGRLGGVVLDLRGNPGGLLDQAVSLTSLFIQDGPIVSAVGRHPASKQYFAASGDSVAPRVPIVALVNGGSASASEIVAAALQDTGRGVVVGSSSYGKGTVQTVLRLPNDGELTLTWARLVSPSGYLLQSHGVVPTVCTVDLADDDAAIATALQRAGRAPAGVEPRTRAALDERGWSDLRQSCPARPGSRALDVKIAERMLADPRIYAAALGADRPTAHVASMALAANAAEASLTDLDATLSSGMRLR